MMLFKNESKRHKTGVRAAEPDWFADMPVQVVKQVSRFLDNQSWQEWSHCARWTAKEVLPESKERVYELGPFVVSPSICSHLYKVTLTGPYPDRLPSTITSLRVAASYLGPLPKLPDSITTLDLSNYNPFDWDGLESMLPSNWPTRLKTLMLPDLHNHPLTLPDGITTLRLGTHFNCPCDQLPSTVQVLTLGTYYMLPLTQLPSGLKELDLGWFFNEPLDSLPPNLEKLTLSHCYKRQLKELPTSLQTLVLNVQYRFALETLPPQLKVLDIGNEWNFPLPLLPESLEVLKMGDGFQQALCLPPNLKKLHISHYYERPLPDLLPAGFQAVYVKIMRLEVEVTKEQLEASAVRHQKPLYWNVETFTNRDYSRYSC